MKSLGRHVILELWEATNLNALVTQTVTLACRGAADPVARQVEVTLDLEADMAPIPMASWAPVLTPPARPSLNSCTTRCDSRSRRSPTP